MHNTIILSHPACLEHGVVSRKGNLRTLRVRRPDRAQWPETSLRNTFVRVPNVITRQVDVLPAQWRYVL